MRTADLLVDSLGRIREIVHEATDNLTTDQLEYRPGPEANSITWLIWHLTRVQDDHVAEVAGTDQVWTAGGWASKFGLPFDDAATGWSHTPGEVAATRVRPAELLAAYHDAVYERSLRFVRTLSDSDLDRIVDERWDPPVTLGVRLVSVLSDDLQHGGQAMYLRGMIMAE